MTLLYQILIVTIPHRHEKLIPLLAELGRQQEDLFGPGETSVGVLLYRDNLETLYGDKTQVLVNAATAEYVSCFDDDDWVAPDFLPCIWQALASRPDYVGFPVAWTRDGVPQLPIRHSLEYSCWSNDPDMLRRDIGHQNPIRRELALLGTWAGGNGADRNWANEVRASGRVVTQAWIPGPMYFYRESTADAFTAPRQPWPGPLPPLPSYPWLTVITPPGSGPAGLPAVSLVLPDDSHVRNVFEDEGNIRELYWHPRDGQAVLDIGSYFGSYAIPALAAGADVIAVEPVTDFSDKLTAICAANGISTARLTVISEALADEGGYTPEFWEGLDGSPHTEIYATRDMTFTTIDALASRLGLTRLDWVKIDVEGAELAVLRGGLGTLARFRPRLLIEDHTSVYPFVADMHSRQQCLDLLAGLGYDAQVVRYTGHKTPDRDFLIAS